MRSSRSVSGVSFDMCSRSCLSTPRELRHCTGRVDLEQSCRCRDVGMGANECVDEHGAVDMASREPDLVFAIAHEIGNHLGAIRLQAHLLDEDLDPRSLAKASVEIDGLAGRAGPLLALIRPILLAEESSVESAGTTGPPWSARLAGIQQHFLDQGTQGVSFEIEIPSESDFTAPDADWLHSLLIAILDATLAIAERTGTIRVGLETIVEGSALFIEDDGPEEELSADSALRGRALPVALARRLLLLIGGRVETRRAQDTTRIELIFPTTP